MGRIDAHQHFWQFDLVRDSWITDKMYILQKDFLPEDIEPALYHYGFDGCIAVQADQSDNETSFLVGLAAQNPFIKGVVGWADLTADNLGDKLARYTDIPVIKGFRHILQAEPNRAYMLTPLFKNGIRALGRYNYTYDILIYEDQLPFIPEFVREFPDQRFVIDHLAKPNLRINELSEWKKHMTAIAQYPNVSCKISGMVTEADWHYWKKQDFTACMDVVFEAYGAKRVMYGSDWPVCRLAATYGEVLSIADAYVSQLTQTEQDQFWGLNAAKFYKL